MPLYEYRCDACGHRFETIQKMSDPPPERCPACGGRVRKMHSAPAFQFKGSGWYVTDYARKEQGGKDAGAKEAEGKEAPKEGAAAEKKEAARTDASRSEKSTPAAEGPSKSPSPATTPKAS